MTSPATANVTSCLKEWDLGSPEALSRLIDLAYDQLSQQAHAMLKRERPGHTLQTRALVHETYIRLLELRAVNWKGKAHFYAMASSIMRRVLVDHARSRRSRKRGGGAIQVTMSNIAAPAADAVDVIALDAALAHLALKDWKQARIVELRYFGGLTISEIAENLSMSSATVKRKWSIAQAFLFREMFEPADEFTP